MKTMSITIPIEELELRSTAKMLLVMADSLTETFGEAIERELKELVDAVTDPAPELVTVPAVTTDAAAAFAGIQAPAPTSSNLDADGLPWDERIHSGAKSQTAKGVWKKLRNVDQALVTEVEAELRAFMAPSPALTTPTSGDTQVAAPVPTPSVVVPPPAAASAITTFPELLRAITKSGIAKEVVQAVATEYGLASIHLVGARPDLIPAIAAKLGL